MYLVSKRHRKAVFIVILAITCCIMILNSDFAPDFYFVHWQSLENISCHYMESEDVLPSGDKQEFPANSIFFHETSCNGGLNSRQACAVESAARAHPNWQINVLFTAPATKETLKKNIFLLQELENVKFFRIHLIKYAESTPLQNFVAGGALNRTRWRISHASDVLRYLTLYKWGGVYLDLDVVVAKSLSSLAKNWAARESDSSVAAGAMAFSRDSLGRSVAEATIRELKWTYRGDKWGHNGPGVITRVLMRLCSTSGVKHMSAASCGGFEVYRPHLFYPIEWRRGQEYFEPRDSHVKDAYVYHVWNRFTKKYKIAKGSPYDDLAKRYCPSVYKTFMEDFGYGEESISLK